MHNSNVTKAGWVGAFIGLLMGMLITALVVGGPARCHEDEVAIWPMSNGDYTSYENTTCVPLDDLLDSYKTGR